MDGILPAFLASLAIVLLHFRKEDAILLPVARNLLPAFPESNAESCQKGGSQGGGLNDLRPSHRGSQQIRLKLHEKIIGAGSPVHLETRDLVPRILLKAAHHIDCLVGDRFQGGPDQVGPPASTGQTDEHSPDLRIPVGGRPGR